MLTLNRQYLKPILFEFESTKSECTEAKKYNRRWLFISSPASGEDEGGGKQTQPETAPILPSPETGEGNLIPDSPKRMVHLSRDAKWKRIFIVGLGLSDGDLLVCTLPTEL